MSQSPRAVHRECGLHIFNEIAGYLVGRGLEDSLPHVKPVFQSALHDSVSKVRMEAVSTVLNFVTVLLKNQERKQLVDLIPDLLEVYLLICLTPCAPSHLLLLQALSYSLNEGDFTSAEKIIEEFIEVVAYKATFLKPHYADVVSAFFQVATAEGLQNYILHSSLSFLYFILLCPLAAPSLSLSLFLFCVLLTRPHVGHGNAHFLVRSRP